MNELLIRFPPYMLICAHYAFTLDARKCFQKFFVCTDKFVLQYYRPVHNAQYTVHHTVHSTQYTVHHTVHNTQCTTQYTVHSTLYTVHSTQYTVHSTHENK